MTAFVPTEWLNSHLHSEDLAIVDASWRMPGLPPAIEDYEKRRIPGAVFFDIDAIADRAVDLPHMLPSPDEFAREVGKLGVSDNSRIVIYDDAGLFSAPRVWWMFRIFGSRFVKILNGGLPKWMDEQRPLDTGAPSPQRHVAGPYKASFDQRLVANSSDVRRVLTNEKAAVLDARPRGRFLGHAPEPRKGLRVGCMPGAKNIPADLLVNGGVMAGPVELTALLGEHLSKDRLIATCGSGVTAAAIALAFFELGREDVSIYDGSWAEWGRESNDAGEYPVAVGIDDE